MDSQDSTQSAFQKFLKTGIHLLNDLPTLYEKSNIEAKREVVCSIFPEKLTISEKGCRTLKINKAVLLIAATDKDFNENKNGQLFENLELSGQVEVTRFELVSKHDIRKLSTCLSFYCLSEDDREKANQSSS